MSYEGLMARILDVPDLVKGIEELRKTGYYDLVSPDWKERLEQFPVYQRHVAGKVQYTRERPNKNENGETHSTTSYISKPTDGYMIIVAGSFALKHQKTGKVFFVARECEPLSEIGQHMANFPGSVCYESGIFFVNPCHPASCIPDQEYYQKYKIPKDDDMWCTKRTLLFNGRNFSKLHKAAVIEMLNTMGTMYAILQMKIYSRIAFQDKGINCYKISGNIYHMILFTDSALEPLINVPCLEYSEVSEPRIEYPAEEEAAEEVDGNLRKKVKLP